jgi:hypothetical protein
MSDKRWVSPMGMYITIGRMYNGDDTLDVFEIYNKVGSRIRTGILNIEEAKRQLAKDSGCSVDDLFRPEGLG